MDAQVAVVGAGPVGLMLAAELRLGGADVVVLEELAEPTTESRASTVHARTMEVFEQRGLLPALGTPPCEPAGHYGGIRLDLSGVPSAFAGQWKVPQARIEQVLAERVGELGGRVLRGRRVTSLARDGERVVVSARTPTGTLRVAADFVVGCDGEHGSVRGLAGIAMEGRAAGHQMLRADVAGVEVRDRRFERMPNGLAIASTRDGVTRLMMNAAGLPAVPSGIEPSFADIAKAWAHVTGEDVSGGTALWLNAFDDENRQAAEYRRGRVLLAGDAAHRKMPVGGQALNLGLQDAIGLGWRLAAEVAGRAPAGLLDGYHEERHAVGRAVLGNIAAQSLLLLGGAEVEQFRALMGELIALDRVRRRLAGAISGVDVRVGAQPDPAVGIRCADAQVEAAAAGLGGPLRAGLGVLLDLTADPDAGARLAEAAAPWADRVGVVRTAISRAGDGGSSAGTAGPAGPGAAPRAVVEASGFADASVFEDCDALLVRPDGYVAWAARRTTDRITDRTGGASEPDRTAQARDALVRWFGAPGPGTVR